MPSYAYAEAKWGGGGLGTSGGVVTWSFALTNQAGQPFDFSGALTDEFRPLVRQAFERWEGVADIDFLETADAAESDIRLGFDHIDGPGRTLAETHYSYHLATMSEELGSLTRVVIRFDDAEGWALRGAASLSSGGVGFYPVALHEIGHALGLAHVTGDLELMNPRLTIGVADLLPGDIAGAVSLYGPRPGPKPDEPGHGIDVFRFQELRSGTHLYTSSAAERDVIAATLPHYRFEGVAFQAVPQHTGADAAYRFFKPETGTHFFTVSAAERDSVRQNLLSYHYEGVAFYVSDQPGAGLTEVYRFYRPDVGTHFYTASVDEKATVQATLPHYQFEGVGFYVPDASAHNLLG